VSTDYKEYVAGFMFSGDYVALILKNRPAALAGRFNGIGGKIKPEELPLRAMIREFKEETGVDTGDFQGKDDPRRWRQFCDLHCSPPGMGVSVVYFFYCYVPAAVFATLTSRTDEVVKVMALDKITNALPNVAWLIPMAQSMERGERASLFVVHEVY
jgi:8-oxo-dGTP pyrophosphatase MutT (NUDIX family)